MEKRKEEATSRFPTSSVYRYKFLFFGTEVCQPAPFGYCYYNRATEKSKDLPLRKFVPRSRFFKIWDEMFKIGKEFFDRSANDTFFTRNILDEIPIHLPNATYRSLSSQIRLPPSLPNSKCIGSIHCGPTTHADKGRQYRPLRRFQLPSPIMDPLLVITVASSLTNNTVPKYTDGFRNRGLSRRARVRETCSRQFDTNSRRKNRKKKKRKSKKKRSINQRNVSTRMHRCTRSLRGNKQANIKISRGWNGKRE